MGMENSPAGQPSQSDSGHGSMDSSHGSMGSIEQLANEQTTNSPVTTERPQHHDMETTYSNEDYTYGHFDGHQKDQSDEECGCTCLTAAEKQRWLDTMDAYDRKLKQWEAQFENQNF